MPRSHPAPILWPAIDIGGTSIRVLLVSDFGGTPRTLVRVEVPTARGLQALTNTLRNALDEAASRARALGWGVATALAMGTPGRLQVGSGGGRTIAPRTAANLEAIPGEMDGVDLAKELGSALGLAPSRVFWENDAVVQGRHMIRELLADSASARLLQGQIVVCINPGTGLGGCVAGVDDATIDVFTDGHISELLLHPVELERDLGAVHLAVRSAPDASIIEVEARVADRLCRREVASPHLKQAEDFLSGTGLAAIATGLESCAAGLLPESTLFGATTVDGVLLSTLIDAEPDTPGSRAARFVADLGGVALTRLLTVLSGGHASKPDCYPDWSRAELDRLRGVSRFVLGGGITGTPLGQHMIAAVRSYLADWPELHLFEMHHIADDAGALGAFSLIPEELRREVEG